MGCPSATIKMRGNTLKVLSFCLYAGARGDVSLANAANEFQSAADALSGRSAAGDISAAMKGTQEGSLDFGSASTGCVLDETKCPTHWLQKGSLCLAPDSYTGPCKSRADYFALSSAQKSAYSRVCQVELECCSGGSCESPAARSFTDVCPDGWALQSGSTCSAPSSYKGSCGGVLLMDGASDAVKKLIEATCDVHWSGA